MLLIGSLMRDPTRLNWLRRHPADDPRAVGLIRRASLSIRIRQSVDPESIPWCSDYFFGAAAQSIFSNVSDGVGGAVDDFALERLA
jgi:hypothetical protein